VEGSPFLLFLRFSTIFFLISLSAILSCLTLGLISLDKVALEVIIGAGKRKGATLEEQRNAMSAKRI
jgi:CBS domain containing-hemolysin-like protein